MPGKGSDTNSGVLWKASFLINSAGSVSSPHRSIWPGH